MTIEHIGWLTDWLITISPAGQHSPEIVHSGSSYELDVQWDRILQNVNFKGYKPVNNFLGWLVSKTFNAVRV